MEGRDGWIDGWMVMVGNWGEARRGLKPGGIRYGVMLLRPPFRGIEIKVEVR